MPDPEYKVSLIDSLTVFVEAPGNFDHPVRYFMLS